MGINNNFVLNRVFTRNTLKELINNNSDETYYAAITRYVDNPNDKNHLQILSEIYKELNNNYRNEYFYKNTLINKLLIGIHSPTTTTALSEVPINKSKADFILINGKAVVYEIKTELDNFERLDSQLNDYYKAFPNVCVITSESNFEIINKKLQNPNVGIYVLTNRGTISTRKMYTPDYTNLSSEIIFKILRKQEYEFILNKHYGFLPSVSQFKYYSECKKMFKGMELEKSYGFFIDELKKRNKIDIELFAKVPKELKSVVYFSKFKAKDFDDLQKFLIQKFGG